MAVSPPFSIDETLPQSNNLLSQYPGQSQPFRDTVESWLTFLSDPATGLLKASAFPTPFTLESTDAGAAAAPIMDLYRNSASPAASDILGQILFSGKDSTAVKTNYGAITAVLLDPVNGSEDSEIQFAALLAGASATRMTVTGTGITLPASHSLVISGGTFISTTSIELAAGTAGDTACWLDFHAQTGVDFNARIIRNTGVNGSFQLTQLGTGQFNIINPSGTIMTISGLNTTFAGDVTASSDSRLKDGIEDIEMAKALNMLRNMDGSTFHWKATGDASVGFIAQKVARWYPELLLLHEEDKYYSLNYNGMLAILWQAVKALDAELHAATDIDV